MLTRVLAVTLIGLGLVCLGAEATLAGPSKVEAVRFLEQTTFGPTPALVAHVAQVGFAALLEEQFLVPQGTDPDPLLVPETQPPDCTGICARDNYSMYPLQVRFFRNALTAPDQLRQRVAFALNQIFVISAQDAALRLPSRMLPYLHTLENHAFGNFRALLTAITLNPGMGRYLDMVNNNQSAPNENYARELLQLFTIGLDSLNLDGTPQHDASRDRIPTYDQGTITAFAKVFTGWTFAAPPAPGIVNYLQPMVPAAASAHDTRTKTLLNGKVLPAGQNAQTDLSDALDNIFAHPNVAPFISKNLIQHLVTSNPSPPYVGRVAAAFRSSGGDMQAVLRAILLDDEARHPVDQPNSVISGHLREPVLWIAALLRAFGTGDATSDYVLADSFLPGDVTMGQDLFRSPSVFNFFPPDHVVTGDSVLGPEFAIYNTSTALARTTLAYEVVYHQMPVSSPNRPRGTWLDLSPWLPLAADPAALVATLNVLLVHGALPPTALDLVRQSVEKISAGDATGRVRNAVYLIVTSPYYLVER